MTSVVVRWKRVGFRRSVMLGAMAFSVACGGEQPASSGSGGVPAGAGMSGGGAGGTSVVAGSGGVGPATGGTNGAGTSGSGAVANGGAGMTGSGGTNAGTAGTPSGGGGAGMAGSPPAGGGGGGAGGGGATGGSGGSQALSFRADIYPVFQMVRDPEFVYPGAGSFDSCNDTGVCHGGEVAPGGGLGMMDVDMAYTELFGVMSESELCNGTMRVAAGDPEASCLILFYRGRLRDELDWVNDDEIDLMRRWIAQGALP